MITNIETSKIFPHPDNPRKNLGELTELADSIRANGIFQNLTVIPGEEDGTYVVIIGHRRLAAAKLAGLETVPCAIADMDRKTQLSTMLLENMQRADLTVYEQGQGFQMMFDLGISVKEIAEKTGFGETTVRKRLTISKLPEDRMKGAEARGGKLEDYIKCCEIENEQQRNKLLESVGTNNFESYYRSAKKEQAINKNMPGIKQELKAFAVKGKDSDRWSSKFEEVLKCDAEKWEPGKLTPAAIVDGIKYVWINYFGTIYVLKPTEKKKKTVIKKSKKEKAAEERRELLKQATERAFELRKAFIIEFSASKKYADILTEWLLSIAENKICGIYSGADRNIIKERIGQKDDNYYVTKELLEKYKANNPENYFALIVWHESGDNKDVRYYTSNYGEVLPEHNNSDKLNTIYSFLCKLGYQMSDEEKALQDGTHELFKN